MKKYFKIALLSLLFPIILKAQVVDRSFKRDSSVTSLNYGDKIPDIKIKNILNYTMKSTSIADLTRGKLVIIDFFATWCVPCIKALPHLDSLQKLFKNQIIILPVSAENPKIVTAFLNKNPNVKNLSLPFITGDGTLNTMFPHRIIPNDVIIDKSGTYLLTVAPETLTEGSIRTLMDGAVNHIVEKKDNLTFNKNYPILVNGNGGDDTAFSYRSILTHYLPGISSGFLRDIDKSGKYYRLLMTNIYPLKLLTIAFGRGDIPVENKNRMVINIPDSAYLFPPKGPHTEWSMRNDICYELLLPKAVPDSVIFKYMFDDMNRLFNIKGSVQKMEMNCWAIVRLSADDNLIKSKGGIKSGAYEGKMRNVPLSNLITFLNGYNNIEEVIDETNINYPVDMDLTFVPEYNRRSYPDISAIRENLNKYGLDIQKVKRIRDVLIINKK